MANSLSPFVDTGNSQFSRQFDIETIGGDQRQRLAEMLRSNMLNQPQGQMVSGWYVAPNWSQYAANLANTAVGVIGGKMLDEERAKKTAEALKKFEGVEEELPLQKALQRNATQAEGQTPFAGQQTLAQRFAGDVQPSAEQTPMNPEMAPRQTRMRPLTQDEQDMAMLNLASVNPTMAGIYGNLQAARAKRAYDEEQAAIARSFKAEEAEKQRQFLASEHALTRAMSANRQGGSGDNQWKYDAGSDTWVKPPNEQFPMGRVTPNVGKVGALQNIGHTIEGFKGSYTQEGKPVVDANGKPVNPGLLNTATQGGWMGISGLVGRATNSQEARAFDNKVEQLSNDLRRVFRIPGEGTLSDRDAAAIGIQLPKLGNTRKLNEQILNDIQIRASNQVMPGGVNPLQMNPIAGGAGAPPAGAVREKKR